MGGSAPPPEPQPRNPTGGGERLPRRRAPGLPTVTLAASLLLCLPACDATERASPDVPVPPGTPLEIGPAPLVAVGVAQGDSLQEFGRVVTPFLLPDDRLLVPDQIARVIRVFDLEGEHLETLGGPGEGPGEFSQLQGAWARGDTIEAFDFRETRVTRFLPDGSAEVVTLRPERFGYTPLPGALPDGWVLSGVENTGPGVARPPRSRDRIALVKLALDGTPQERLAETRGVARYTDDAGSLRVEPLSSNGVYVVEGGMLYVGETLTPRINRYDPEGNLEREITWEPAVRMDPATVFETVVDSAVAMAAAEEAAAVRRDLDGAPAPEAVSVFWDFLVDGEGFVWVRPYEPLVHAHYLGGWSGPGPGGRWLIFSPEGEEVGTVDVPDQLVPMEVGTDAIVGIVRDDLGVQTVQVHAIRRR